MSKQAAMSTQEKSLALAKLMGWHIGKMRNGKAVILDGFPVRGVSSWVYVEPYSSSLDGLAQFAAILLEFPEAVTYFACNANKPITQENLLDEILRMNGVIQ